MLKPLFTNERHLYLKRIVYIYQEFTFFIMVQVQTVISISPRRFLFVEEGFPRSPQIV